MGYNKETQELLLKEEDFILVNEYDFLKAFIENAVEYHNWHITDIAFNATTVVLSASFRFNRPVVFRIPAENYIKWKESKINSKEHETIG